MTLNVDYGDRREVFEYSTGVTWWVRGEQIEWCEQTFPEGTWRYYHHQGAMYFKRERDLMLFQLRWA